MNKFYKITELIWVGSGVYFWLKGATWLFIIMLMLYIGNFLLGLPQAKRFKQRTWIYYPILFCLIFSSAIFIKVLILDICFIPSASMKNMLFPGDRVIINKLSYGPRIPRSLAEIPWVNGLYLIFMGQTAFSNELKRIEGKAHKRWKGISHILRGDVVVFNSPVNYRRLLAKRFVGLPGDTIFMTGGKLFINGIQQNLPNSAIDFFCLWPTNKKAAYKLLRDLELEIDSVTTAKEMYWISALNTHQLQRIEKSHSFDSIKTVASLHDLDSVLWHDNSFWKANDFGPFVIPAKDMSIPLNPTMKSYYKRIIDNWEKLSSLSTDSFTFNRNYYFALGDNRSASLDSRKWGLVPEENIVGKADLVLISQNESQPLYNRFLKPIR